MSISPSADELKAALGRVDWDFPRSATPYDSVHSLHWFPGNFIPQIPSFLIQALSRPGDLIVDPFCGSGTTGVEAALLGRHSFLSDVNRASVQVAQGKLAVAQRAAVISALPAVQDALVMDFAGLSPARSKTGCGEASELRHWLYPDTLSQLRFIWSVIEAVEQEEARAAFQLLFTDVLFSCGSAGGAKTRTGKLRRHHWGWIADNVRPAEPAPHDAIAMFRQRLSRLNQVLNKRECADAIKSVVALEDARGLSLPAHTADLIVTSPPYIAMVDYTLANRLTYLWMNWGISEDLSREIGARRYRKRVSLLKEYLEGISAACQECTRILKPGGFCALVIGGSRAYPAAAASVIDIFSSYLNVFWGPTGRLPSRRRVAEGQGREAHEYIVVFQK